MPLTVALSHLQSLPGPVGPNHRVRRTHRSFASCLRRAHRARCRTSPARLPAEARYPEHAQYLDQPRRHGQGPRGCPGQGRQAQSEGNQGQHPKGRRRHLEARVGHPAVGFPGPLCLRDAAGPGRVTRQSPPRSPDPVPDQRGRPGPAGPGQCRRGPRCHARDQHRKGNWRLCPQDNGWEAGRLHEVLDQARARHCHRRRRCRQCPAGELGGGDAVAASRGYKRLELVGHCPPCRELPAPDRRGREQPQSASKRGKAR